MNNILNLLRKINPLSKYVFGRKKLMLAFEYGVVISEVARKNRRPVTKKLSEKAEEMLMSEFAMKSPTDLSVDMAQNVLSVFELDLSK